MNSREKLISRDNLLWTHEIVNLRGLACVGHHFVELPPLCHFLEDRLDCSLRFGKTVGRDRDNSVESRLLLLLSQRLGYSVESVSEHSGFLRRQRQNPIAIRDLGLTIT